MSLVQRQGVVIVRVLILSAMLGLVWVTAGGMEIAVPPAYTPPEWFSAASGEEFVVAASEVTSLTSTLRNARVFWLKSSDGVFQGVPDQEVFEYEDYTDDHWIIETFEHSICHWASGDRPSFRRWHHGLYWYAGSDFRELREMAFLSSPGFYFGRFDMWFETWYTFDDSTQTDYDFTPAGDYVAVERFRHHGEPFDWSGLDPIDEFSVRVVTSDGLDQTYEGTDLHFATAPRYNPATHAIHVLGIDGWPRRLLVKYHFSDSITTSLIWSGSGELSGLDYRPDPDERLHLIWSEAGVGLRYAICEGDVVSTPVLLADYTDYQFPFTLKANGNGGLYLFNLTMDGRPTLWTRYYDASDWEMLQLDPIAESFDRIDGMLNADGGLSFLAYSSTVPDPAFLWHSDKRGGPLRISILHPRDAVGIVESSFTANGNVGLLVEKTDGSYSIVTNVSYGQATPAGGCWLMYP